MGLGSWKEGGGYLTVEEPGTNDPSLGSSHLTNLIGVNDAGIDEFDVIGDAIGEGIEVIGD